MASAPSQELYKVCSIHFPALSRLLDFLRTLYMQLSVRTLRSLSISLSTSVSSSSPTTTSSNEEKAAFLPTEELTTVLYLAYGSNLASATFRGRRGIRPLRAIPVHVPALELVFDLPGVPYIEPAFANVRRVGGEKGGKGENAEGSEEREGGGEELDGEKKNGLVGVVYEVSLADYRTIIATEGGGATYEDVVVPCYPLPPPSPSPSSTHTTTTTTTPVPVLAHTLLAPPAVGRHPSGQPSKRYLGLLTSGAAEHSLPASWQQYLAQLRPYTITQRRQRLGAAFYTVVFYPLFIIMFALANIFCDEQGRAAPWVLKIQMAVHGAAWTMYDKSFSRWAGNGERTQGKKGEEECKRGEVGVGMGDGEKKGQPAETEEKGEQRLLRQDRVEAAH